MVDHPTSDSGYADYNAFRDGSSVRRLKRVIFTSLLLAIAGLGEVASIDAQEDCRGALRVAGVYSNFRHTAEHAYGYGVELWRCERQVVGLFSFADGQDADFPTDRLAHVSFDADTGKLSFDAFDGAFHFTGLLTEKELNGQLTRGGTAAAPRRPIVERTRVTLRRRKQAESALRDYATSDEWRIDTDRIVSRPGPGGGSSPRR